MFSGIMLVIYMIIILLIVFGIILYQIPDMLNQLLEIKKCYKNFKDEWSKK